jgi:SAM-dependent methyltransferase
MDDHETTVRQVQDDYARIAKSRASGGHATCCKSGADSERFGYESEEIASLPQNADMGLGCGAPVPLLALVPGETVLDLGSGGGIDVFLAARQVGPDGHVIGIDMTPEMIELARSNAERQSIKNVEFREGRLEAIPVDDGSVDAVTSNCVIALVPDKASVFAEIARVLRPGGRMVVSDVVFERPLPDALLREIDVSSCITTALPRDRYLEMMASSGLADITVLRDVDFLELEGWHDEASMNDETRAVMRRAGVTYDDVRGAVRSITVGAHRPRT